jgi:hypothetical protein
MPIWFNVEKARNFLLEHGLVYTLRPHRRKREGTDMLCFNGFGKKGIVDVTYVGSFGDEGQFDEELLDDVVPYSGFDTLKDWLDAAFTLSGTSGCHYLYRVKLLSVAWARVEDFPQGKA